MAVTHSERKAKTDLLGRLLNDHPAITFRSGSSFAWSQHELTITYPGDSIGSPSFAWSILHELGHALLGHETFTHDLSLIRLERDAWDRARELSVDYGVEIPDEHIEACMDSYRDWLYARSLCPHCHQCGIQTERTMYSCVFCNYAWNVSESRLCRTTRRNVQKNRA